MIEEVRAALAADLQNTLSFAQFNGGAAPDTIPDGLPADLRELLLVADGLRAGSIDLAAIEDLAGVQYFLDYVPRHAPVADDPDVWLVVGTKSDEPLFMERQTGSVWHFPPTGTEWFMGDRFEPFAQDPTSFLLRFVFGSGYRALVGNDDRWYEFLGQQGLPHRSDPNVDNYAPNL